MIFRLPGSVDYLYQQLVPGAKTSSPKLRRQPESLQSWGRGPQKLMGVGRPGAPGSVAHPGHRLLKRAGGGGGARGRPDGPPPRRPQRPTALLLPQGAVPDPDVPGVSLLSLSPNCGQNMLPFLGKSHLNSSTQDRALWAP